MWWAPAGSERLGQTSVKLGQPWSNLVKLGEMCFGLLLEGLWAWWTPIGLTRLDLGCLVLRVNTQENPGGKNRVMTRWMKRKSRPSRSG
jgi:hypothetical protein